MKLVVVLLMEIHWIYSSLISASYFLVEEESSMDLKIWYPLSCSSTVKKDLVLVSMTLRNLSLSDEYSSRWIVSSASVRVPVTSS